jgi:ABC-type dipeptide/oligopeptide/nickel transport system permease component
VLFYLLRRILWAAVVSVAAIVLTFLLVHLAPGNPVAILAGERSTLQFQLQLTRQLGLDQPLPVQLLRYLQQIAHGNLGYSFTYQAPVLTIILSRLPATLLLMGASLVISTPLGAWIGTWAAVKRRSLRWNLITIASVVGYSIPAFWLGQVLILVLGVRLGWFPIIGISSTLSSHGVVRWGDIGWHLVMPVMTLSVFEVALISRLTRASMLEVLDQDYMVAARGKGLSWRRVIYRHGLRNGLLPVITVFGLELGSLVAGFVVVETVFSWPGLGRLTFDAISARDYPVITGLFIFVSISVVIANLLTDLVYLIADPRIRYG